MASVVAALLVQIGAASASLHPGHVQPPPPRAARRVVTSAVVAGPRVKVVSVGKTKEAWLQEAIGEYTKRLRGSQIDVSCMWVRDDNALCAQAEGPHPCVLLDEGGDLLTSTQFSRFLFDTLERGGSRATFIIGAADGLPPALLDNPKHRRVSLSRMTFTHQMARLVLIEQIYRAAEIRRGSNYHRE